MTEVFNVTPENLKKAADGINGVIGDLTGGPLGSYESQLGRGFDNLSLTGEEASHPAAKAGVDNFVGRWEYGTRALVVAANDIGSALDLGAGMIELQEQYYANAGKDMLNDIAGDPSLTPEQIANMSLAELYEHNKNSLTNPDWSPESFAAVQPTIDANLQGIQSNAGQAALNLAVPTIGIQQGADGFINPDQQPAPTGPGQPTPTPTR